MCCGHTPWDRSVKLDRRQTKLEDRQIEWKLFPKLITKKRVEWEKLLRRASGALKNSLKLDGVRLVRLHRSDTANRWEYFDEILRWLQVLQFLAVSLIWWVKRLECTSGKTQLILSKLCSSKFTTLHSLESCKSFKQTNATPCVHLSLIIISSIRRVVNLRYRKQFLGSSNCSSSEIPKSLEQSDALCKTVSVAHFCRNDLAFTPRTRSKWLRSKESQTNSKGIPNEF